MYRSVFDCLHSQGLMWDVHDTTSPWIFTAVYSVLSPTAFLLNLLVIITITKRRELQRASKILLRSMAVSDLLVGGISMPLSAIIGLLLPHRILTERQFCTFDLVIFLFSYILYFCSFLHLTMIAWERYMAIRKCMEYKMTVTKGRLKILAMIAWVLSIGGVSSVFISMTVVGGDGLLLAAEILDIISSILILCLLIAIVYFYVMVYLSVRKRKLSQIQQVRVLVKAKLENRVAMTMALVTVALVISFIPMTVVFILGDYFQVFRGLLAWRVVETLVYLNSIASPLIYCYRDRLFRTAVLEILRIRKPKAKQVPVCNAVRFVRRKDSFGSVKDVMQIRNVENPVILTRPASCDLAMLSLERGHLQPCFHKTRLKRSASAPSLKKDSFCYD